MQNKRTAVIVASSVLIIAIVVVALFVNKANKPSTNNTTTTGNSANAGTSAKTNSVAIENFAFSPASITVKVGTTVTWTNNDSANHTVTSDGSEDTFDSGSLATGKTFSHTFSKTGTFKYRCTFHPDMTGSVLVTN